MAIQNAISKNRMAKRAKFGIPKVNQNPQAPNAPKMGGAKKLQDNQAKKNQPKKQPINLAPPVDPRDDQYWRDVTQLNFNKGLDLSQSQTAGVFDRTSYEQALMRRTMDEPLEVQRMREGANRAGTIYSTSHQENLGQLGQQQFQTRADLESDFNQAEFARRLQEQGIHGNYNLDAANAYGQAAGRASEAELDRPGPYIKPPKFPAPHQQGKGYGLPAQKHIDRINAARKSLAQRVAHMQKAKASAGPAQKEALNRRIKKANVKRAALRNL